MSRPPDVPPARDERADRERAVTARIRANFDRGAGAYARFEGKRRFFSALIDGLFALAPPPSGAWVLDVGCGTGASLAGVARAVGPGGRVVGVDISMGMLKAARQLLGPGALLAQGDGCAPDRYLKPRFDAVVYNAVLFMIPDGDGSLAASARILKPGGLVYVSLLDGARGEPGGVPLPALLAERGLKVGTHSPTPAARALESLAARIGPARESVVEIPMDREAFLDFYGLEPMSAGLMPAVPYPERMAALETFAADHFGGGSGVVQRWRLAAARRPVS